MKPGYIVEEIRGEWRAVDCIVVDNVDAEPYREVTLWYCHSKYIPQYTDESTTGVWKLKQRKQ